jgi:hypothetical protein
MNIPTRGTITGVLFSLLFSPQLAESQPPVTQPPVTQPPTVSGIVGDGIVDNSLAIQRAVNAGVGELKFSKGVYRITKTIDIELNKATHTAIDGGNVARIVMDGPGPAFRFIGTHDGTASPATVKRNVWNRQSSPTVSGIDIVGNHPDACGIEARGTMQLTVTQVGVRECLHGIHLVSRNRNVILSQCNIYDNDGVGVYMENLNLHQINIANCHISYNDGGGVVARNSEIRNLQIGTCDIEGNMGGPGSQPTANVYLDSTGSSIGEVAIVGCTIQHSHDAPGSANIRIEGLSTKRPFTDEQRHGNVTIADNVLSDVQVNVVLSHVRAATVSGNTMWKGYTSNLVVNDCRSVVVTGNVFDRNPRYHYSDGATAKHGLYFVDSTDCTISGNQLCGTVDGEAAMVVRRCNRFNITGCSIVDYGRCGLLLEDVSNSRVSDCLIRDDREGADGVSMWVEEDNNVLISDCMLSHGANE